MAKNDEKIVAIAGKLAQEKYGLVSLANDIQMRSSIGLDLLH